MGGLYITMYINEYFKTPVWMEEKPEFVKSLNKASDKYIKTAKKMPDSKKYLKQFGDFGRSWHSTPLTNDNDFTNSGLSSHHIGVLK